jgi:uncharacterized PurR-regulated membrane protein YhhQ (DUF165 family)
MKLGFVLAYLIAIVLANLSLNEWGPRAAIYNAFLFIGLDLTTRDRLHDLWRGKLLRNMAVLIAVGSALSYVLGLWLGKGDYVGQIALASCIAFGLAASSDAASYHLLRNRSFYERVNQSNMVGAAVDSIIFLALLDLLIDNPIFNFSFALAFGLFCAKVAGGVVWSFVLRVSPGDEWLQRNRSIYGADR